VRILVTTMMMVALAAPAYAQVPGSGSSGGARPSLTLGGETKSKTEDELKEEKEREDAYKAGVNKIPDQKAKSDPWGNLRTATPQSAAKQQRPASK